MMPSKKKKYNARFPAGRIKKIMQKDEDVGKVAQAVPVIISRALELFVESLLKKTVEITNNKNAKTLTPSHMKQCIVSESRFDFLKDLVSNISDVAVSEDEPTTPIGSNVPLSFPPVSRKVDVGCTKRRGRGGTRALNSRNSTCSSSHPTTPVTPTTPVYPTFYKEIPIGDHSEPNRQEALTRPPVIQHTANHCPLPDNSGDEEEEDDEIPTENGYSNHSSRPLLIDDDYDT